MSEWSEDDPGSRMSTAGKEIPSHTGPEYSETNLPNRISPPASELWVQNMQGKLPAESTSDWVDHGIIDVPVVNLPKPEDIAGPQDFDHHITWEDAKNTTAELPKLQSEVQAGKTRDDFHEEDCRRGLDYEHGRERLFDLFYGSDPIVLDKVGDNYTIVSGRHRIFAAKEAKLDTIPARVREKIQ